ncbi:hypothetical protein, partial [Pseudomonas syringae group genomosp. 3]
MGQLLCISIRMTLLGFGSRLRCFYSASVAKSQLAFLLLSLFSGFIHADDIYVSDDYGNTYSNVASACSYYESVASKSGYTYQGGYSITGNKYFCPFVNQYGTPSNFTGYIYGDTCPTGTSKNSDGSGCARPVDKCIAAKGQTQKSYSWNQSTDTPSPPSPGGCATTISGVGICTSAASGGFTCTADITITGDLYVPPTTQPTPDPTPTPTP